MLSFTDSPQRSVAENATDHAQRKYFESEPCQGEFTNQSKQRGKEKSNHAFLFNGSSDTIAKIDDSNEMFVTHGTLTPGTVSFIASTNAFTMEKACIFNEKTVDKMVNEPSQIKDEVHRSKVAEVVASQNREFSETVSYKRLPSKNRLSHKNKMPQKMDVASSTSSSFQCNRCQKKFKRRIDLHGHQVYLHNKSSKHQCIKCDKYLPTASKLRDHMSFHEGIRNYQCAVCQKKFHRKCDLKRHFKIHTGERPFMCEICNQRFTHNATLHRHMMIHTGEKPHVCEICYTKFSRLSHLRSHMKTHIFIKP